MNILKPFKTLPLGYYRLLIVGAVTVPVIFGLLLAPPGHDDELLIGITVGVLLYYVLMRLVVWVYDGFKKETKK